MPSGSPAINRTLARAKGSEKREALILDLGPIEPAF
jgi:hypothetical protein